MLPPLGLASRLGAGFAFDFEQLVALLTTGKPSRSLPGYLAIDGDAPHYGVIAALLMGAAVVLALFCAFLHCTWRGAAMQVALSALARRVRFGRTHLLSAVRGNVRFQPIGAGGDSSGFEMNGRELAPGIVEPAEAEDEEDSESEAFPKQPPDPPPPPFDEYEDEAWEGCLDCSPLDGCSWPGSRADAEHETEGMVLEQTAQMRLPKRGVHSIESLRVALAGAWLSAYGPDGTPAHWARAAEASGEAAAAEAADADAEAASAEEPVRGMVIRYYPLSDTGGWPLPPAMMASRAAAMMVHTPADFLCARGARHLHVSHSQRAGAFLPCLMRLGAYEQPAEAVAASHAKPQQPTLEPAWLQLEPPRRAPPRRASESKAPEVPLPSSISACPSAASMSMGRIERRAIRRADDPFDDEAKARDTRNQQHLQQQMSVGVQFEADAQGTTSTSDPLETPPPLPME